MRINIDLKFFSDYRIQLLSKELKCSVENAVYKLLWLWKFCYENTTEILTADEIDKAVLADSRNGEFANALLAANLAESTKNGGFRICGTKKRFKYLISARDNGKKGGLASAKRRSSARLANVKQTSSEFNPPTPSSFLLPPAPVPSPAPSSKKEERIKKEEGEAKAFALTPSGSDAPPKKSKLSKADHETRVIVWETYKSTYKFKYGVEPPRSDFIFNQIGQFIGRVGREHAPRVVEFYLSHPNQFYAKNNHAFRFCLQDCEKLLTEFLTGNIQSGRPLSQNEIKSMANEELMRKIDRGEL